MIEPLYDTNNLYKEFLTVKGTSGWKETTQRYEEDLIFRLGNLKKGLVNGTYRPTAPYCFPYYERGKLRNIESYCIDDRIVQGCFTNNVLLPIVRPKLIYDNSASLKQRGTDHFRRRLELHLREFAKEYGNDGYILLGDFTKYFDNLRHAEFLQILRDFGADMDVINFARMLVDMHKIDVSYMTDAEYARCMDVPFNSIEYMNIDRALLTGEKFMLKSLGIGSHIAQIAGVVYPYEIDNYCKIVRGIRGYGRYMDDFYAIHHDKEYLWELLNEIKKKCAARGLFLNDKKTQIVALRHKFTILKTQYQLLPDSTIIRTPDKSAFVRCRHKLKKMKLNVEMGIMTKTKVDQTYKSTRGTLARYGVTHPVRALDDYYEKLFIKKE